MKNNGKPIKVEIICEFCNKKYWQVQSVIKKNKHNFCCFPCYNKWKSKNVIGISHPKYNKIRVNCNICKKEFFVTPSQIKIGEGKYCSRKCSSIGASKSVKVECSHCGKHFELQQSKANNGRRHFCSKECTYQFHIGPNASRWIKDRSKISDVFQTIRESDKMKDWKKEVYRLDNYKCVICGKVGVDLRAHHIVRFQIIVSKASGDPMEYTPLWDTNNGVTLCEDCHKSIKNKEHLYESQFFEHIKGR